MFNPLVAIDVNDLPGDVKSKFHISVTHIKATIKWFQSAWSKGDDQRDQVYKGPPEALKKYLIQAGLIRGQ